VTNKKRLAIAVPIVTFIVAAFAFLWLWAKADLGNLPPENYTSTTMYPLKTRILRYTKKYNKLPASLADLPPLEGFINSTKDIWGNEIIYQFDGTTVKLTSYGKDRKPGGVGENLDVVGVFETKNSFGGWAGEDSDWKIKPLANRSTARVAHNKTAGPDR
jgi:hypothetical protein